MGDNDSGKTGAGTGNLLKTPTKVQNYATDVAIGDAHGAFLFDPEVADPNYLEIDQTEWDLPNLGGSFSIEVIANTEWSVGGNFPVWLSYPGGIDFVGRRTLTFNFYDHADSTEERSYQFLLGDKTISITQAGAEPNVEIYPETTQLPASGGSQKINYFSNTSFTVAGIPSWMTLSPTTVNPEGDVKQMTLTYTMNPSVTDTRSAELQFGPTSVRFTQVGEAFTTISQTFRVLDADATTFPVEVSSNTSWTFSNIPNWVSVSPATGTGSATVEIVVQANNGGPGRTANLQIGDTTLTLNQDHGPMSPIIVTLPTATTHSSGWIVSDWFGWLLDERIPWIYHAEHGWLYLGNGNENSGFLVFDRSLGAWVYLRKGNTPWRYAYPPYNAWLFYQSGGVPGQRWFFRGSDQRWYLEADLPIE